MIRYISILLLLFTFTACSSDGEPVSPQVLSRLTGEWWLEDGSGKLIFYRDTTVKILMPKRKHPLKLISSYEQLKGGEIGIATGDRWIGPISCRLKKKSATLEVIFPDDKAHTLVFRKRIYR